MMVKPDYAVHLFFRDVKATLTILKLLTIVFRPVFQLQWHSLSLYQQKSTYTRRFEFVKTRLFDLLLFGL